MFLPSAASFLLGFRCWVDFFLCCSTQYLGFFLGVKFCSFYVLFRVLILPLGRLVLVLGDTERARIGLRMYYNSCGRVQLSKVWAIVQARLGTRFCCRFSFLAYH